MAILTRWIPVLAAAFILGGCASPGPGINVAELLKQIEAAEKAKAGAPGPDAPDAPSSSIPPSPVSALPVIPLQPDHKAGEITIQPDSLVQISVDEDKSLDGSYPVNEIGAVELGYVGPVILMNKTEKEAAFKIRDVLKTRDFKNATVHVRILRASYDSVGVVGAVNRQGQIRIGAGDTISLNDLLLRAGGIRTAAKGTKVKIVRSGLRSAVASALEGEEYSLMTEDNKPTVPNVFLRNNDVAFVFASDSAVAEVGEKSVLVLGEVGRQGVYSFHGSEPCTVMHLLLKMGGLPTYANIKDLKIIRRDKEGREQQIKVNASKILEEGNPEKDIPLENGDRVVVPARRLSIF
ncbi:MAG: hypothetical protein C0404_13010 [Verrucomicrobia bacterium]|nr:hypothetical protein [Verrucomicrobiota bacterium]